jgi:hypothetical protein
MIAVVVGNDHRIDVTDIAPERRKLFFSLNAVYTRIEEELYPARFDIDAVAVAA